MLRSFSRAGPSSSSLRTLSIRKPLRIPTTSISACFADLQNQQTRSATQHAISNPTLAGIEKRWEGMPPQEQADLWMALRDRMKNDWHELTLQERKAAYWIAFGPHGPRALPAPGEGWYVFRMTMLGCGIAVALYFFLQMFVRPPPRTMTKEYQQMSNEYLRNQKTEPITGVSSEGYRGKGMVQSKPAAKSGVKLEEEE